MDGKLPDGWVWTTLGKIAEGINPGFPSGRHNQEGIGVPHIRPMNISRYGDIDLSVIKYVEPKDYSPLMQDDVLFNNTNSPDLVGKTTYIRQNTNWAYSNHMTRIRLRKDVASAGWVAHALHYLFLDGHFKLNCRHHVNQASIGTGFLAEKLAIPLPPLPEQERIVRRIESLFTRLDAGVVGLRRAQAALKRYRASVLKAACEGRLLANGDAVSFQDNGLPPDWQWTTVRELTQKMQYGTSEKAHMDEIGIPVLRMGNIQDGELDFNNLKYLSENTRGIDSLMLYPGDVLFNRTNSAELVGKTAVYRENHPRSTFASYLIRVKLKANVLPDYVSFYINSYLGRRYIASVVSQQVGQANVNGTKLANMPIPLPPFSEQKQIVAEVERRLSVVQEVEAAVQANLARAARLRQAILKRAFEGQLV